MRLRIIASSSSGNCALMEDGQRRFLIDAGLSFRKIENALQEESLSPQDIEAIFITHEHSDHVAGLAGFISLETPIYATAGTISSLVALHGLNWKQIPSDGGVDLDGLRVESFSVPHDAAEPVGYSFSRGDDKLVWALDLGHMDVRLKKIFRSATILVLESNYCPKLLENSKRPWTLKQRIRGRHGHLSNEEAYEFLSQETNQDWHQIYLAHLSSQCNDASMLEEMYEGLSLPVEIVAPKAFAAPCATR
jgi:phosphoribosyl 1,2-cyclic phosphodiesterase